MVMIVSTSHKTLRGGCHGYKEQVELTAASTADSATQDIMPGAHDDELASDFDSGRRSVAASGDGSSPSSPATVPPQPAASTAASGDGSSPSSPATALLQPAASSVCSQAPTAPTACREATATVAPLPPLPFHGGTANDDTQPPGYNASELPGHLLHPTAFVHFSEFGWVQKLTSCAVVDSQLKNLFSTGEVAVSQDQIQAADDGDAFVSEDNDNELCADIVYTTTDTEIHPRLGQIKRLDLHVLSEGHLIRVLTSPPMLAVCSIILHKAYSAAGSSGGGLEQQPRGGGSGGAYGGGGQHQQQGLHEGDGDVEGGPIDGDAAAVDVFMDYDDDGDDPLPQFEKLPLPKVDVPGVQGGTVNYPHPVIVGPDYVVEKHAPFYWGLYKLTEELYATFSSYVDREGLPKADYDITKKETKTLIHLPLHDFLGELLGPDNLLGAVPSFLQSMWMPDTLLMLHKFRTVVEIQVHLTQHRAEYEARRNLMLQMKGPLVAVGATWRMSIDACRGEVGCCTAEWGITV
ncbi:hypothetical protein VOLCADRAFT_104360 [Volvox carteri f. nagariensis]|uniref:Uncharacterized protein n=1 Tax=Volvox carteri f. nagariensis TaxID=3068 RepID=D8TT84_VOLCA|nr:uncharacterized protein VOLCADRAFT_104360 [Volvox carteri f. nagariensis]EFJ49153.1 hypothetical protein VOLCADRAFT_104360 [Volvox carteri f. nagariensis]|eukprot:XP_002949601.1 hypothetical protein VOLCADRAFT_104360 [Volvox carteri f. nagariensis]